MAINYLALTAALLVSALWALHAEPGFAQAPRSTLADLLGEAPQGFGRNTTGGCADESCECKVTTLVDDAKLPGSLRACAESPQPHWIVFSARGPIVLKRPIAVASNKIIDGRKRRTDDAPVIITGSSRFLFLIENSENVVVSDLYFRNEKTSPGNHSSEQACMEPMTPRDTVRCGVLLQIRGKSLNVWINHTDFDHCGAKCITVWTAPSHGKRQPGKIAGGDLVTISNSVFRNSFYAVLVGADAKVDDDLLPDQMRVTLYGNVFYNVFRRSPRASSYTKVHAFNNVMKFWGRPGEACTNKSFAWASSAVGEAQLLLENNVYVARPEPTACKLGVQVGDKDPEEGVHRGTGKVRIRGNVLLNGAVLGEREPDRVFDPKNLANGSYAYPYTLLDAVQVEATVESTAGVRGFARPSYRD